jgi:choline dehydrogenase-like flavoprotein
MYRLVALLRVHRGKLLGGSSGINGMAWTRASALEYDAWEQFGPDGEWGWDGVLPYFKKSETHTKMENPYPGISAEAAKIAEKQEPQFHGYIGPMVVCGASIQTDVSHSWVS